jgi:hypothetical protein
MLHKTVGVALIVVLGLAWWMLQELRPSQPAELIGGVAAPPAAATPGAVVASSPASVSSAATHNDAASQQQPALRRSDPVPTAAGAAGMQPGTGQGSAARASAAVPPPVSADDAAASGGYAEALAEASRLQAAGDRVGAEGALRQAIQRATTALEAARAGMQLAAVSSNAAERRQLLGAAVLEGAVIGEDYEAVAAMLRELNRSPGVSLIPLLALERYTVKPNDSLWKLCNKVFPQEFGATPEVGLVQVVNGMSTDRLKLGQVLAVPTQAVTVKVDMLQHGLSVWLGDTLIAAYRVGLGKEQRTPAGSFTILVKQENPTWFFDGRSIPFGDPENVLGTRWMGFDDQPGATGLGIHGTSHPESIGRDESMGCVRMRNAEVEELFTLLPRGTQVTIS